jgi:hypothetical protein
MATHRGSSKRHGTPPGLDKFFKRHIIEEEDYAEFWKRWWKGNAKQRDELVNEYIELAAETTQEPLASLVTRNRSDAEKQAQALSETTDTNYRVVRRNAKGRFSKRGTYWQAIPKGKSK